MSNESATLQLTIENLEKKIQNQGSLISQLTQENEELFHQFNHLMIRNNKLLKRIDDQQKIIDDLHLRIEELHLINGNMLKLNDRLRVPGEQLSRTDVGSVESNFPFTSGYSASGFAKEISVPGLNMEELFDRWKNYPGQVASNAPNIRKQVLMLACLYMRHALRAGELFQLAGVGGVTGARYVSTLKKFGLISFNGARKKGHYEITGSGISFIEGKNTLIASLPAEDYQAVSAGGSRQQEHRISKPSNIDESDL